MGTSNKPSYFLLLFLQVCVLTLCENDMGYYKYETTNTVATLGPQQVVVKRLEKRQAEKDKSKAVIMNKETKTQLDQTLENSSQSKLLTDIQPKLLGNEGSKANSSSASAAVIDSTSNFNETLPTVDYEGNPVSNLTVVQDHHKYYNSSLYMNAEHGMQFWVDLDAVEPDKVVTHSMLSQSHRRAATIRLTFDFPFYGHLVRNVTIATGGFLYTGDYVHAWLAATQYIAPLMANFDTSLSNDSTIKYWDNGTALTVQWDRVVLQDRKLAGSFTFQATLRNNGDVIFVYKDMPLSVTSIGDEAHPVKVGLSDAYVLEKNVFFTRRKIIYEYHQVNMKKDDLTNGTAIYFSALPSCVSLNDCSSCIANTIDFECVWCPRVGRCSDGTDRHRQDWIIKECDKFFVKEVATCANISTTVAPTSSPAPSSTKSIKDDPFDDFTLSSSSSVTANLTISTTTPTPSTVPRSSPTTSTTDGSAEPGAIRQKIVIREETREQGGGTSTSAVVGILFFVALIVTVAGWIFYAYRNPHTPSGQFLIRYRPSGWRWRSGEAHYTAAAIHM